MNKIIIICALCLSCVAMQAQNIFPKDSTVWNVLLGEYKTNQTQIIYALHGDTIINDTVYSKLYLMNDSLYHIDNNDLYYGGIRQEGQRVYFRYVNDEYLSEYLPTVKECLLYDFSKNIGDSIEHGWMPVLIPKLETLFPDASRYEYAKSCVQDVSMDSKGRKHIRVNINSSFGDEWVEGVGSFESFFWALRLISGSGDVGVHLRCMKVKDKVEYLQDVCESCYYQKEAGACEVREEKTGRFCVFSDFNEKCVHLVLKENSNLPCLINIFDMKGNKVIEEQLNEISSDVYFSDDMTGIFIYQIKDDSSILQNGKIILK